MLRVWRLVYSLIEVELWTTQGILTMTEPEAYKLRTVLNQVLDTGRGSINEISGRIKGGVVEIVVDN